MMFEDQIPLASLYQFLKQPSKKTRQFDVPPGRIGIVIDKNGAVQTYEPGQHTLPTAGAQVGFIPAGAFNVHLKAENLLSRDSTLVDASLLCAVEIFDRERFFRHYLVPQDRASQDVINLAPEAAWEILAPGIRRRLVGELLAGKHSETLMTEIRPGLEPVLNHLGLHLDFFHFISFLRSEDRFIAAEQALHLAERLQDVENRKKIVQATSRQELDDVLKDLGVDAGQSVALHPLHDPVQTTDASEVDDTASERTFLSSLLSWAKDLGDKEVDGQHFRITNLFQHKDKAKDQNKPQPRRGRRFPQAWWRPRVIWMLFIFALALGITKIEILFAGDADWSSRWEFYLIVWGIAAGVMLESLKHLYQKWEDLQQVHWVEAGTTFVDDLVGHDRVQADMLVRKQTHADLQTAQNAINDLRSRVYQQGDVDMALKLRALEQEFSRTRELLMNPNRGIPPYVTDLKISRKMWDDLLDYDEGLLVRSSVLGQDVQAFVQEFSQGKIALEKLKLLQASLDALKYHFENRSQALKSIV
jgi:hypothetical protein